MMKHEFEELAGYEVSNADYNNIIEPMYMATNLDKREFVKCIDKKRFALKTRRQLINEMKKLAEEIAENCEHSSQWGNKDKLDNMAKSYFKRFYGVDWGKQSESFCFFDMKYTYEELGRGCTYPYQVQMGIIKDNKCYTFERIILVK